jgi:hypothetical protein
LIKGSGDALTLTDEQVAAVLAGIEEEETRLHASFVRR